MYHYAVLGQVEPKELCLVLMDGFMAHSGHPKSPIFSRPARFYDPVEINRCFGRNLNILVTIRVLNASLFR